MTVPRVTLYWETTGAGGAGNVVAAIAVNVTVLPVLAAGGRVRGRIPRRGTVGSRSTVRKQTAVPGRSATVSRGRGIRGSATRSVGGTDGSYTGGAATAVRVDSAVFTGLDADDDAAVWHAQATEEAVVAFDAGHILATVRCGGARFATLATVIAESVATGHAQGVELAGFVVALAGAAVVRSAGVGAGVVLHMADVALRLAGVAAVGGSGGRSADADFRVIVFVAAYEVLAGQSGATAAAAVGVVSAEFAHHVTTTGGLADVDAAGAVGRAESTAAVATAVAQGAFNAVVAARGARRGFSAGTDSGAAVGAQGTGPGAALGAVGANVAGLNAE